MSRRIVVVLGLALLGACGDNTCISDPRDGVHVTVIDQTGHAVFGGLAGTLTDRDFVEQMEVLHNELFSVSNRRGVYVLTIAAPGFEPWLMAGVRIRRNDCGPVDQRLTAELIPVEGE